MDGLIPTFDELRGTQVPPEIQEIVHRRLGHLPQAIEERQQRQLAEI
jgi:hypothetical protein